MGRLSTAIASTFALSASALSLGGRSRYNYTLTQPSAANPLGNPAYPGYTSSNGPNWVGYLTFEYNASALLTYNFAYGGATVDSDLVEPYEPTILSVKDQVETEFVPGYTGSSAKAEWSGDDSIFAVWIGINDIGYSYYNGANATNALNTQIFAVLLDLMNQIYDAGGRNYLFINVPPLERTPLIKPQGETAISLDAADVADWNQRVVDLGNTLKAKNDTNVWVYDSNTVFNQILDDPTSFPQTAGLKNTTDYCAAYQNGTPSPDTLDPSCGVPVNEYFWLNNLHPTPAVHEVVAQGVADLLTAGPNI
ncbi:hypothetical protein GGR50DRAFT_694123 [Xylaria sp. CBS 124048]|nr:hypothetical protein GGR50DRAFT_694123 [Xylaria sp. CBS 124048]